MKTISQISISYLTHIILNKENLKRNKHQSHALATSAQTQLHYSKHKDKIHII